MSERLYTVQGQRPTRQYDAANNVIEAIEVTYVGPNGIGGHIVVPTNIYTPENVDAAIRADLEPKLAVAQLGQG